jgi:hypothetical protein
MPLLISLITADFNPLKEKLYLFSSSFNKGLGNFMTSFPSFANLSIIGPPGNPRPKALATLS